ncbi:MAG: SH3 domain-containing protein [Lachnospiraceae bacterium]|nr:SH3 domain-containing protein [Lachnospiraceae bacterium]
MSFNIDNLKEKIDELKKIDFKDKDQALAFLKKNVRGVVAGILILALFITLFVGSCGSPDLKNPYAGNNLNYVVPGLEAKGGEQGDYKVNSNNDLNKLVRNYFNWFAEGNVGELEKLVSPLDENQKNLVIALSEYIEGYQNIAVYFKDGPVKDSYMVSVYHETKFKDIATRAPGLTTFYIHKNDNGTLIIDNRPQSQLEEEVVAYLEIFKTEPDVIELAERVNTNSTKAFEEDPDLYNFVVNTYQKIYTDYYAAVKTAAEEAASKAAEEEAASKAAAEEEARKKAEEEAAAKAAEEASKQAEQQSAEAQQPQPAAPAFAEGATVYANDMVNIRKQAEASGAPVGMTEVGSEFTVLGVEGEWVHVKASNGYVGYIKSEFLQTTKP